MYLVLSALIVISFAVSHLFTCCISIFIVPAIKFRSNSGLITVEKVLSSANRMNVK